MKDKVVKIVFIFLSIVIPFVIVSLIAVGEYEKTWSMWGRQEDGSFIYPDWTYSILILFKITIYFLPPFIYAISIYIRNKLNLIRNEIRFIYLEALHWYLLILVSLKLLFNTIFEIDRLFGVNFFNSVEEVQVLVAYIITFVLKEKVFKKEVIETKMT